MREPVGRGVAVVAARYDWEGLVDGLRFGGVTFEANAALSITAESSHDSSQLSLSVNYTGC